MDVTDPAEDGPQSQGNWTFVGDPPATSQGWKLYVSSSNDNFAETLRTVAPVFSRFRISFKHVSGDRALRKINSGLYGYSQIGKTIVAYLEDEAVIKPVTATLKRELARFANSTLLPPFAEEIGAGLPLSYRYGAYSGDSVVIGGVSRADRRSRRTSSQTDMPSDPFAPLREPRSPRSSLDALLTSYPVFEVISQSAKSGIYAALDLSSPSFREVIIKLGRHRGHILPDGRDGSDLTRREAWFYAQAKERNLEGLIPTFDKLLEFDDGAVMIIERLEGETLQQRHQRGGLDLAMVERAVSTIEAFHSASLLVGDAKLANFMISADGSLKAIDFESGSLLGEGSQSDQHTTFHFTDRTLLEWPAERELLHFLYSILHKDESKSFDEATRIIDLEAVVAKQDEGPTLDASVRELMRSILARVGGLDEKGGTDPQLRHSVRMSSPAS